METYIKIDDEYETIKEAYIATCSSRESGIKQFENNTIEVVEGYHLTEEDRIAINKYIDDLENVMNYTDVHI